MPLQTVSVYFQHLAINNFEVGVDLLEHHVCEVSSHEEKALDCSLAGSHILVAAHVLDLPVVELHHEFEVGLVFMLSPEPAEEAVDDIVVVGKGLGILLAEVDEYSGVDAGDAVEYGFGEVHFPLVFPGGKDILHLSLGIDEAVVADGLLAFANLLLVHREDVQRLVEFDALAKTDVFCVVAINHLL